MNRLKKFFKKYGFTLIELIVVILIVGIISAYAIPRFANVRQRAYVVHCQRNQRHIFQAAVFYSYDNIVPNGVVNVKVLWQGNYLNKGFAECPESKVLDYDDYDITFRDGGPIDVNCNHKGVAHPWPR